MNHLLLPLPGEGDRIGAGAAHSPGRYRPRPDPLGRGNRNRSGVPIVIHIQTLIRQRSVTPDQSPFLGLGHSCRFGRPDLACPMLTFNAPSTPSRNRPLPRGSGPAGNRSSLRGAALQRLSHTTADRPPFVSSNAGNPPFRLERTFGIPRIYVMVPGEPGCCPRCVPASCTGHRGVGCTGKRCNTGGDGEVGAARHREAIMAPGQRQLAELSRLGPCPADAPPFRA
jgi:hypothetical protein